MKTFKIPVEYKLWGLVEVEANSLEEAIEYANENISEKALTDRPEYVEASFEIAAYDADELKLYNEE